MSRSHLNSLGIFFVSLLLIFSVQKNLFAQPFLNGNLSTGAISSNGTAAPSGAFWSELTAPNTTLGFSVNIATNTAALDDFTVPVGQIWNLTNFICYA